MSPAIREIIAGDQPVFLLIAGPNGASKSTFTDKRLKQLGFPVFDPDAIARQMFGRHPADRKEALSATQEATRRVRKHFENGESVGLETVFSDIEGYKLGLLREAQSAGFRTVLIFIGVDSADICITRVMDRVQDGGHDVPDEVIRERFPRSFANLKKALPIVDLGILIDNSGCYGPKGIDGDGLRHYQFAVVACGKSVVLEAELPRWFTEYGVGETIESRCRP